MFLKPCVTLNPVVICQALRRPSTFTAFRSLATLGFASSGTQSRDPTCFPEPILQSPSALKQGCGPRPMLWANAVTGTGFPGVLHSNAWRKRLSFSETLVQRLAPFGGAIALSAGSHQLRTAWTASRSKRRHALDQRAMLIDTSTPASMQQAGTASTSSSGSDTDPYSSGDPVIPSGHNSNNNSESSELRLSIGASSIPHPEKEEKGGEDAYFISEDGKFLGIADGVGGWAQVNIDAGVYSRTLMENAKAAAARTCLSPIAPQIVLEQAHMKTNVKGTSTACILALEDTKLHAANVGDSGFIVVRSQHVVFKSPSQQHRFNFPFQLGCPGTMSDLPEHAELYTVEVSPGDIVVAATDGLFDNVYNEETAVLVSELRRRGQEPEAAASGVAQFARTRAADPHHLSPFAHGATLAGWPNVHGGKMDDITVVVAYVLPGAQSAKL